MDVLNLDRTVRKLLLAETMLSFVFMVRKTKNATTAATNKTTRQSVWGNFKDRSEIIWNTGKKSTENGRKDENRAILDQRKFAFT